MFPLDIYIYFRPVLSPDVYVYAWHAICIKNNAVACRLIMHASEATVHALYILISVFCVIKGTIAVLYESYSTAAFVLQRFCALQVNNIIS